jgi:hypothetical protein
MPQSALAKKMKLKPGVRAAVINTPGKYLKELKHDTGVAQKLSGKFDWIQAFVKNKKELASLAPGRLLPSNLSPAVAFLPQRDIEHPDRSHPRQGLG